MSSLSSINLILQFGVLLILVLGVLLVTRLKINLHGYMMLAAVVLNLLSIVLVMLPSAMRILSGASLSSFTVVTVIHSAFGVVVEAMGAYIVLVWRFRMPGRTCFKLRTLMRAVTPLWILVMTSGVAIYMILYA